MNNNSTEKLLEIKLYKLNVNTENDGISTVNGNDTFIIPAFQRDFVWSLEDVKKLLQDLCQAKNDYFIGNIVTYKQEDNSYIVVDGQQRLTVLYLLSIIAEVDNIFTLQYDIREKDGQFLNDIKKLKGQVNEIEKKITPDIKGNFKSVTQAFIQINFKDVCNKKKNNENNNEKKEILKNLLSKVIFTITTLPSGINRGDYYIKMNARGKQLEQYWIVRAKIFQKLGQGTYDQTKQEAKTYKNIFDACTNMNRPVWKDVFKLLGYTLKEKENIKYNLDGFLNAWKKKDFQIDYISKLKDLKKTSEDDETIIQPLIKPETFLLHVLNLWLKNKNEQENNSNPYEPIIKLDDKQLNNTFKEKFFQIQQKENENETKEILKEDVKNFIKFLLKIRVLYDLFIYQRTDYEEKTYKIDFFELFSEKSEQEDQETQIKQNKTNKSNLEKQLILVQQLLHVTDPDTTGRKWISVALCEIMKILKNKAYENQSIDQISIINSFIEKLESYDNQLANQRLQNQEIKDVLNQGTSTPHYWFYKTDYLLWKINKIDNTADNDLKINDNNINILSKFYITQQQSVEHIIPQSEHWESKADKDKFGNLALISKGLNSKLSDKDLNGKLVVYEAHIKEYHSVPSLKLWLALNKANGNQDYIIDQHHKAIIELLKFYLNRENKKM